MRNMQRLSLCTSLLLAGAMHTEDHRTLAGTIDAIGRVLRVVDHGERRAFQAPAGQRRLGQPADAAHESVVIQRPAQTASPIRCGALSTAPA